jgi:hypothetical protein
MRWGGSHVCVVASPTKYGMLCRHLFEDAEKDLKTVRYAQRAVSKIWRFLTDKTENTPLKDAGFFHTETGKDEIWMFPATDAGLPHRDLEIAVGWRRVAATTDKEKNQQTSAYVTTGRDGTRSFVLLVLLLDHDPSDDTDIAWKLDFSEIVHEFVHVLDYRRGYLKHRENIHRQQLRQGAKFKGYGMKRSRAKYFNSPIEFNAYYQQGVSALLNELVIATDKLKDTPSYAHAYRASVLASYAAFQREFHYCFDNTWLRSLNAKTKHRFVKRLYQLFVFVRQNWPDMDAIKDMTAENKASAERWKAADDAQAA